MDCVWIGWAELKPEVQAAWVQAVGSVAAILAAVAIAWWQQRRADAANAKRDAVERCLQEARARSLALVCWSDLVALAQSLANVAKAPEMLSNTGVVALANQVRYDRLQHLRATSWELGDAAAKFQELLFTLDGFGEAMNALADPHGGDKTWHRQMLLSTAAHAAELCSSTKSKLMAMFLKATSA